MSEHPNRSTEELRAEECYEAFCVMSGDQVGPDWGRLSIAQREMWRRIVRIAWGQDKSARERQHDDSAGGRVS